MEVKLKLLTSIFELFLLALIVIEDEKTREISVNKLLALFIISLIKLFLSASNFPLWSFLLGNSLYFLIYFLAKGNFGLGDVFLNGILSLNFQNPIGYFRFFTLTFALASLISIILVFLKRKNLKSKIPFAKYIVAAYFIEGLLGGYFV